MVAAVKPRKARDPDEALRAMIDRQAVVIETLLDVAPMTAFANSAAQRAFNEAQAMLAELGRAQPDRFEGANAAWLMAREKTP